MTMMVTQLYKKIDYNKEYCFNVESSRDLAAEEMFSLRHILADRIIPETVSLKPFVEV